MTYVIDPPARPSLPVQGREARFPVRRVYCVGRNYEAHAREMGADPRREPPFIFQKPSDAVVSGLTSIPYPPQTRNLHHEIELVVAIGRRGVNVSAAEADALVFGYGVGIDLTRRDLQQAAKDGGKPWEWGKAFDNSAPCSALMPADVIGHPVSGRIWLSVNGVVKQNADISELIWSVAEVIAFISASMVLEPGDLIFTGTPAGVGPLAPADHIQGGIDGIGTIEVRISDSEHR
jgi:fumarylpyruvate hydrolase